MPTMSRVFSTSSAVEAVRDVAISVYAGIRCQPCVRQEASENVSELLQTWWCRHLHSDSAMTFQARSQRMHACMHKGGRAHEASES